MGWPGIFILGPLAISLDSPGAADDRRSRFEQRIRGRITVAIWRSIIINLCYGPLVLGPFYIHGLTVVD
jgi:hypothetical protein